MIRLRTFGTVELLGPADEPCDTVLTQPKRLALLFYLVAGGGYQRRDTLFGLFWRDVAQARARAALNQSIYFLRRELGSDVVRSRGNDEVGVDRTDLWCDAVAFEAALERGDRQDALRRYGGELLPGFFLSDAPGWERWLDGERRRHRDAAARAARELADEALVGGDATEARRWARRVVDIVPYDEVQLRRLLALLARIGDRTGALRVYDEAIARYGGDEGEMSATTRALVERIRAGEVEEVEFAQASPAAAESSISRQRASQPMSSRTNRRIWPATVLVLGALLTIGALRWASEAPPADQTVDPGVEAMQGTMRVASNRIAILPFSGDGLDPGHSYLADALTESLIRRLSEITGVGVIAWMSVEPYRDGGPSAAEIGDELGARYLIEGSLESVGDSLRLGIQLFEPGTGKTLWSDRHKAAPEEIAGRDGEIALDIARAVAIDVGQAESERLRDPGTEDAAARLAYLEGRYLLGKSDERSIHAALDRFRAAVDLDPTYALAWSGLSDAYDHLAGIGTMSSERAYSRARSAAERALAIDPDLAEAHSSLAMALSHHYWMSEEAARHWRRALELKPGDARVHRTYAGHLRNLGRFEHALAHATLARDLDPIPFYSHFELLVIPYFQGRYEEVIELAEQLVGTDPSYAYAHFLRALALVQLERHEDALAALNTLDSVGTFPDGRLIRAYIQGRLGETSAARRELRRYEEGSDSGARGFERAILHLALDERRAALTALEEAYDASQFRLRLLGYEPLFDPLRDDPRFQDLLARIGLPTERPPN